MAHSKRNTSLPHFTSYERGLLRSSWGTKTGLISRDSFLPFASCRLCLQPARPPVVACSTNGDIFCRECAISDLLAQRQEIKRLEREREEAKKAIKEEEGRLEEEAKGREVKEFEVLSLGLEGSNSRKRKTEEEGGGGVKAREVEVDGKRKRIFELDEKEIERLGKEERERLMEVVRNEKVPTPKSIYIYIQLIPGDKERINKICSTLLLGTLLNTRNRSERNRRKQGS